MSIDQLFDLSNLFVLPFWALMILVPNWDWSRRILQSFLPFVALALLYIYFLIGSLNAETAQALANPDLAAIGGFFSEPSAAATGWTHFLVMDLFVGRWIYWEGQRTGVFTRHSLALCLFAGPFGLLSHIGTAAIQQWLTDRRGEAQEAA
ncbi:MAG: ABA4-like family protein [Prochlorothrix sp.]